MSASLMNGGGGAGGDYEFSATSSHLPLRYCFQLVKTSEHLSFVPWPPYQGLPWTRRRPKEAHLCTPQLQFLATALK